MPLLSVLWGFALLSLIAISLLATSGTSRNVARNALEATRMGAVAEAALVRTAMGLSDSRPDRRWIADRRPEHFEFDGLPAVITVQDELGRIDLNYADRGLLFGLLRAGGMDAGSANQLIDAILDHRAPDAPQSATVADVSSGLRAEQSVRRHGLFQSVDELRLVPGMTSDVFGRIVPALTVYSQHQAFDPELAPPEALLALPGMTPDHVAELLSARAARQQSSANVDAMLPPLKGRAFTIRIRIGGQRAARTYEAAIRFTGDPDQPYWLLDWHDQRTLVAPQ